MKDRRLYAYHDGELSPGAEARAARTLERSPEDRAELARLAAVGDWVREADAVGGGDVPDLWGGIAARLPAIDAERAEAQADGARGWWWRPLLAGAAATAAAAVVLTLFLQPVTGSAEVVQWLDAEGAPVMVFDAEDEATVIWVLDEAGGEETSGGASRGLA